MVPKTAAKDHPWQGFSRFKKGFAPGTRVTHYPGAYFLPINQPKYFLFKSMKKIKNYFDL
jgi:lipid II:glycine glycyltransferase (peptidoglycan interpeptide bridge formation enzyme)